MRTIRYELDPYNRFVAGGSGDKSDLPEFRQVIEGRFRTGENGELSYHVKAPLPGNETIPNQLKIRGRWSMTDGHCLCFTVDKSARDTFGDRITLQGEILDVTAGSILFAVTTRAKGGKQSTYVLNLEGLWKADENNRLSFHIRKEDGRYDILTFNGAWEVNKNYQIIYQYEKYELIKSKRELHTLTFKGYWDIAGKFRISYLLEGNTCSGFIFQTSAGVFKEDRIEYELGIRSTGTMEIVKRTITLFGAWNLKKDVGLIFEIGYAGKESKEITFGAGIRLTGKDTVSFSLKKGMDNKDMGISLRLSRGIFEGDGQAFLRLLKSGRESAVYAGSAWRW